MILAAVLAVVVHQVVSPRPLHRRLLLRAKPAADRRRRHRPAPGRREGGAAPDLEPGVPRHERLVVVVHLVLAVLRRPRRSVPDRAVHPHRAVRERPPRRRRLGVPPYRHVVHQESTRTPIYLINIHMIYVY